MRVFMLTSNQLTTWCLVAASTVTVLGRLFARGTLTSRMTFSNELIADIFVVLAWLSFVTLAVVTQLFCDTGFFDSDLENEGSNATPYQLELNYITNVMLWPCLYFVKFALLCFFDRIIQKTRFRKTWLSIRVIAVICVVAFLYSEASTIFYCWPIKLNWDLDSDCQAATDIVILRSTWGLHMVTDVMIYCVGFSFLGQLREIPLRDKLGAASMFALGFIGIIASSLAFWAPGTNFEAYVYRAAEQATLIIVACIPSLKFLVNRAIIRKQRTQASANSTIQSFTKSPNMSTDKHNSDSIA